MNSLSTNDDVILAVIRTLPVDKPMIVGLAESMKMPPRAAGSAVARLVRAGKIRVGCSGLYLPA